MFLIALVWWPLVEDYLAWIDPARPVWAQLDWLLLGIFAAMTLLIMADANLRRDARIVAIGVAGGLVIESWGTRTGLWSYFTHERPPLWILPAWPIASLAIDRLTRILDRLLPEAKRAFHVAYGVAFASFYGLLLYFVRPTLAEPLTLMVLVLCAILILTPSGRRTAVLTFAAGSALGYFLEWWGTTRACWTYYTLQTPPLFAVLAHGMAAVAFWRAGLLVRFGSRKKRLAASVRDAATTPSRTPGRPVPNLESGRLRTATPQLRRSLGPDRG